MAVIVNLDDVKPIPNSFDKFATMTYAVSIYLVSPSQYQKMVDSNINSDKDYKDVSGFELLIQSGGINNVARVDTHGAKRTYFKNDYYLNDIQLVSSITGTETNAPHNTYSLNFTVTEQMGITFQENLFNAVKDFNTDKNNNPNPGAFLDQFYLMVIRFYGYDINGNQITASDVTNNSDTNSFSEKWIPFKFRNISFRLENSKVVYRCEAVPVPGHVALDRIHGDIPFNVALQGQTLDGLLNGKANEKEKSVRSVGLIDALNKYQIQLVKEGKQDVADKFSVEFQDDELKNAVLISPGTTFLGTTGMPSELDPAAYLKAGIDNNQVTKGTKSYAVNGGIKIVRLLDLIIRTSSFISSQYYQHVDQNKTGSTKIAASKNSANTVNWFKISPRVTVQDKFDHKRNMYAYDITFVIQKYPVPSLNTKYFGNSECFYPHKEYNYWFTGKNTEILSFNQDFNFLYYSTYGSSYIEDGSKDFGKTYNSRNLYSYRVNSRESNQGAANQAAEAAANAASELYSPADQAQVEVDIVGDPDWIGQSELFYPPSKDRRRSRQFPDGSIDYDAAEVFFSINFNTVVDYDVNTGLADVTAKNVNDPYGAKPGTVSQYSFIYRANNITTQLTDGKFVQKLEGTLMDIPENCITGTEKPRDEGSKRVPTGSTSGDKRKATLKTVPAQNKRTT